MAHLNEDTYVNSVSVKGIGLKMKENEQSNTTQKD